MNRWEWIDLFSSPRCLVAPGKWHAVICSLPQEVISEASRVFRRELVCEWSRDDHVYVSSGHPICSSTQVRSSLTLYITPIYQQNKKQIERETSQYNLCFCKISEITFHSKIKIQKCYSELMFSTCIVFSRFINYVSKFYFWWQINT